ncbi:organic cation transporter protein-like isoform X3 [Clavelina lepadiformis]|uniref:organic cation transporter protein-like isoform X3 n=1 Tax=Clavelina lepadiformis TaxID=159417 RepID=UPI004041DF96
MYEFDVILNKIGGLGPYQIVLILMVSYSSLPSGYNSMASIFVSYYPDYRCRVPPIDNNSFYQLSEEEILNLTTPYDPDTDKYDTCYRYGYNLSLCEDDPNQCVNKSADPIKCDVGYHYDTSVFTETTITEFNLVCNKSYRDTISLTIYMVGAFLGTLVFGNLSDRWGRKPILTLAYLVISLALLGSSFANQTWIFDLCRFLVSFFDVGSYVTSFVYLLEIVPEKWTTVVGVSFQIGYALGYMILSGIAYQWRNWHQIQFVLSMFSLPSLVFLIFIPESPRWLFTTNRVEKGKEVCSRIAKYNKVKLNEPEVWDEAIIEKDELQDFKKEENGENERKYSTLDLFKTPKIRLVSLKVIFCWFVNALVYYGVSLNVASLSGDVFLNNALGGIFEIGIYLFVIFFMDRTGRRLMLSLTFTVAGVGLLASTIVNIFAGQDQTLLTLSQVFALTGRTGIAGSYAIIYNVTTEVYPTVVRAIGVSAGSMTAQIGSILVPFFIALDNYISWLPNTIFSALALLAAFMAYSLPETNKQNLMETIEEAEMFYSGKQDPVIDARETSSMYTRL